MQDHDAQRTETHQEQSQILVLEELPVSYVQSEHSDRISSTYHCLSISLQDFIPHMAKEYNFEYELVQYKWPRWLHQQKEKQRIIWG